MTKISRRSRNLFHSIKLFFFVGLFSACAKTESIEGSSSREMAVASGFPRIIGGEPVKNTENYAEKVLYLAMGVRIQNNPNKTSWTGHCTASAISQRVILTAAHCVEGQRADQLSVVLTKDPSTTPLNLSEWYSVKTIRAHDKYGGQRNGFINDLALILLERDLPISRVLQLANPDQVELPIDFMAVGYGTTSDSRDARTIGQKTSLMNFVMKNVEDFDVNKKTFSINQNDHKGFCSGDSGGPGLIYDPETHEYWILGVVSNVSMQDSKRKILDPQNKFSLCIGQGNYVNVLNPELRDWIEETHFDLMKRI